MRQVTRRDRVAAKNENTSRRSNTRSNISSSLHLHLSYGFAFAFGFRFSCPLSRSSVFFRARTDPIPLRTAAVLGFAQKPRSKSTRFGGCLRGVLREPRLRYGDSRFALAPCARRLSFLFIYV